MGHSRDDKTKSHRRIVEIAAARMREAGTSGPGVAEIMQEAGLTHGGFYKHFASRDQLVAEAAELAFDEGRERYEAVAAETPIEARLSTFVDRYTSTGHRDDPATGCGVAAFGADAARGSAGLRGAYGDRVAAFIDEFERLVVADDPAASSEEARRRAVVAVSSLVGSLVLARAVDDDALSREILADVASAVKGSAPR